MKAEQPSTRRKGGSGSGASSRGSAVPPSGWNDWTGGKPDDVVLVELDDHSSPDNLENLARLVAALGWEADTYFDVNQDVSVEDEESGFVALLAHFVRNGANERRRFSKTVEIAKAYVIEQSVRSGEYMHIIGWTDTPLTDPHVVIRCQTGDYAIVPAAHIGFWRDDVARHLSVPIRKDQHGFMLVVKIPLEVGKPDVQFMVRDGEQLLLGTTTPRTVELDEFVRTPFQVLQDKLSYEEMACVFEEHYGYLDFLNATLDGFFADPPAEFRYEGERITGDMDDADLSVCAVLLGRSVLLKPFISSLVAHRPEGARWEILLLANSAIDLENIKLAAEWCAKVYGIRVSVFASRHNLGFGGGMNFLVARARGRLTMMSNIDIHVTRLDMADLSHDIESDDAIIAAYQFNPGGSLQHEGLVHDLKSTLVNGRQFDLLYTRLLGRNTYPKELQRKEVAFFGAACVVAATTTLIKLGPFSSSYFFAYHEDCDMAWRARASGIKCALSPALQIVHYESSGAAAIAMPLRAINAANLVTFMRATGRNSA